MAQDFTGDPVTKAPLPVQRGSSLQSRSLAAYFLTGSGTWAGPPGGGGWADW